MYNFTPLVFLCFVWLLLALGLFILGSFQWEHISILVQGTGYPHLCIYFLCLLLLWLCSIDLNIFLHLIKKKMVTLFANTFRAPYYEHLMGSSAQHFYDAVWIAKRIEQGIQSGRIAKPVEKGGFVGKKKETEVIN